MTERAITIHQPWASFIASGDKDVENRSWQTAHRGRLWIHAGRLMSVDTLDFIDAYIDTDLQEDYEYFERHCGHIVGCIDVLDVVRLSDSAWFSGPYGWVLGNPQRVVHPFKARGRPGLWQIDMQGKIQLEHPRTGTRKWLPNK